MEENRLLKFFMCNLLYINEMLTLHQNYFVVATVQIQRLNIGKAKKGKKSLLRCLEFL